MLRELEAERAGVIVDSAILDDQELGQLAAAVVVRMDRGWRRDGQQGFFGAWTWEECIRAVYRNWRENRTGNGDGLDLRKSRAISEHLLRPRHAAYRPLPRALAGRIRNWSS